MTGPMPIDETAHSVKLSLRVPTTHNPYIVARAESLAESETNSISSEGSDASNAATIADAFHTYHRALWGRCLYVSLPDVGAHCAPFVADENAFRLFFGQIKREVTPMQLRWIIRRACGVTAMAVEMRSNGCFYAAPRTSEDAEIMKSMHRRVLFDAEGVWIARDDAEALVLSHYVARHAAEFPSHFPKSCMLVEEPRTKPMRKFDKLKLRGNAEDHDYHFH